MDDFKIGNIFNVPFRLKSKMESFNDYYLPMSEWDSGNGVEIDYYIEKIADHMKQVGEQVDPKSFRTTQSVLEEKSFKEIGNLTQRMSAKFYQEEKEVKMRDTLERMMNTNNKSESNILNQQKYYANEENSLFRIGGIENESNNKNH